MKFEPVAYKGVFPRISKSAMIAPNAIVTGDTKIGDESNIWYGVVIRGDVAPIVIGKRTNIQDGAIIHVTRANHVQNKTGNECAPTIIGDDVTVGHMAMLHACRVDDLAFIGMSSLVMDLAHVESEGMVAGGAVIAPKRVVKRGEIWAGNPGKLLRKMSETEMRFIKESADNYVLLAKEYGF